jgi:hypothetical protein
MNRLHWFLESEYHVVPGEHVPWRTFYADFMAYLAPRLRQAWPEKRVRSELEAWGCPVGRGPANRLIAGNLSRYPLPRRWVKTARNVVRLERREPDPRDASEQDARNQGQGPRNRRTTGDSPNG